MKKQILILLVGALLVGTLVAGISIAIKEKEISEEDYNKLASVNSTEITATDINCSQDDCDIVYISTNYGHTSYKPEPYWENCIKYLEGTFECLDWEKIYYTDEELELQRDEKIEDLKNRIIERVKINEEKEKDKKEKKVKVPKEKTKYKEK